MPLDHAAVIDAEAARLLAAYEHDRAGTVPWSDRWTVGTVARHVAGTHHVVAQVLDGRPTADFGRFADLDSPAKDDPGFPGWFAQGTATLCDQLRSVAPDEECWSWYPEGRSVRFWARRMAHETLVHRWDAEAGAALTGAAMDPEVAADGVEEYLDVFVKTTRELQGAPAGPLVHLQLTDAAGAWLLDLREPGGRSLAPDRDPLGAGLGLRGPAEGMLLFLWGRLGTEAAGVEVDGDPDVLARWGELIPPM